MEDSKILRIDRSILAEFVIAKVRDWLLCGAGLQPQPEMGGGLNALWKSCNHPSAMPLY